VIFFSRELSVVPIQVIEALSGVERQPDDILLRKRVGNVLDPISYESETVHCLVRLASHVLSGATIEWHPPFPKALESRIEPDKIPRSITKALMEI
jgi:hypothetical protein